MSEHDDQIYYDVVSYFMIGTGAFFSLLNIILILANYKTLMRKIYPRLMLIIQLLHFIACITDMPYYAYDPTKSKNDPTI
jgi:hypothetical protein